MKKPLNQIYYDFVMGNPVEDADLVLLHKQLVLMQTYQNQFPDFVGRATIHETNRLINTLSDLISQRRLTA